MARMPTIINKRAHHPKMTAPIAITAKSVGLIITMGTIHRVKYQQGTGAATIIREMSAKVAAIITTTGMNQALASSTNQGHRGSTIFHPKIS
jgi:hypothetical protein